MALDFDSADKKDGYAQLEPNHLSGQRTGQIHAQWPLDADVTVLENGMFLEYVASAGELQLPSDGTIETYLVFNEVKLYEMGQTTKDFAMLATDAVDAEIVPRVYKTNLGDIITTNAIEDHADNNAIAVGDTLTPNSTGFLSKEETMTGKAMVWQVIALTTMPDGQAAVKLLRTV